MMLQNVLLVCLLIAYVYVMGLPFYLSVDSPLEKSKIAELEPYHSSYSELMERENKLIKDFIASITKTCDCGTEVGGKCRVKTDSVTDDTISDVYELYPPPGYTDEEWEEEFGQITGELRYPATKLPAQYIYKVCPNCGKEHIIATVSVDSPMRCYDTAIILTEYPV